MEDLKGIALNDVLKYLEENGKIDSSETIKQLFILNKKEKYVNQKHTRRVQQSKTDKRWRTYVVVDGKQKQIVRTTKESMYDYLYSFYSGIEEDRKITFEKNFENFKSYKSITAQDNTITKYEYDYKRFFGGTTFSITELSELNDEVIAKFIIDRIQTLGLKKKTYESFWGYISGSMKYAYKHHLIETNPMDYLERKDFARYCVEKTSDPKLRVASDEEMGMILNRIYEDRKDDPLYMPGYAVELATMTGMRVGELSALMWESVDFENGIITIDKAEVLNQKTREYKITKTKNRKIRYFPITEDIKNLLFTVRKIAEDNHFLSEFVFSGKNGQTHKIPISDCIRNKCYQIGIPVKSIHTIRRTFNSKLKVNGTSSVVAASLLGHSVEVNEGNYTYDVTDMDYKRSLLETLKKVSGS